jgi:AcrR family transcriptional regulator
VKAVTTVATVATAKDRLIDAAFDLFTERGFEQTTVDDIADRAGVGRTTFFRSFRSKEQVIFPDHERLLGAIRERLATATAATWRVAVPEAARLVLAQYVSEGERARRRYALTRTVPALRDRERAGVQQYERLFTEFIHRCSGGAPETALRAELMANAVVTAHNHVLRRWLREETDDPEPEFDDAMATVMDLFKPALGDAAGADSSSADSRTAVVVLRSDRDPDELAHQIEDLLRR